MSRYDFYTYTPTAPIKTDEGIKARSKRGAFVKSWWATRWIKALERLIDKNRLGRGRRYARAGQVVSLDETTEGISAKVQGSRRTPYKVTIAVDALDDAAWDQVFDILADQAIFTAQLLAGEMPDEIEEVFSAAGVSLFPDSRSQLITDCSCPDWSNPCKHVAAVHYILGEQFDEDPFLLFRFRGRSQDQVMEALRTRRAGDTDDDFEEEAELPAIPLDESLDNFWGGEVAAMRTNIKPPTTPYPILKRLGQPNFVEDDLVKLLGPVYQAVTEQVIEVFDVEKDI
ncbi:MAG: SWIM zinc finger family protein [Chloroflexota bacterium]